MLHVYILESLSQKDRFYTGITEDVNRRLKEHNNGKSIRTNKYKPWKIKTVISFDNHKQAEKFELYLKTASERTFSKKRL